MYASISFGKLTTFFFSNRIHLFFMPVVLTLFWNMALNLMLPFEYYCMIFFTTMGSYILNIYTDYKEDSINYNKDGRLFRRDLPAMKSIIAISFLIGLILSLKAGWKFVLYGGIINILGSLYSAPISIAIPNTKRVIRLRIKEITFLKNIYASLFWSFSLICTPFLYLGMSNDLFKLKVLIIIAISFGLNYFLELCWDLRDIEGDRYAGVRTVVLVMGERFSIWVLRAVHIMTCVLMIAATVCGIFPKVYYIAALHFFIGIAYLQWYDNKINKELASHVYLLYACLLIFIAMILNKLMF
jgi:4-hydroxybenzoate polyprenyltransferase